MNNFKKILKNIFIGAFLYSMQANAEVYIDKAEPNTPINLNLPIHKKPKTHPEISDPVLGDQAEIAEWAWNKEYAKLADLNVNQSEIIDENLLLIGVKVKREQSGKWQRYTCTITGIIKKDLPIVVPDEESYLYKIYTHSLPKNNNISFSKSDGLKKFTPSITFVRKNNIKETVDNKKIRQGGITVQYEFFDKNFSPKLYYFKTESACAYFGNPDFHVTKLLIPKNDKYAENFLSNSRNFIELLVPDLLMKRIYPYVLEANDWSLCLMRRVGNQGNILSIRSTKYNKFGNICDNKNIIYKNQLKKDN